MRAAAGAVAPDQWAAWRMRAYTLRLRAAYLGIEGRMQEAVAGERTAFAALQRALALPGADATRLSDFVRASLRLGITLRESGLYDEATQVIDAALVQADKAVRADPGNELAQRLYAAPVQTAMDLCLHRGDEAAAAALYASALACLPPLPRKDELAKRHWQHAWMDALQAVCWVRTAELERAEELVQRLQGWQRDGSLRLREHAGALDAELEANIAIAVAYVATARGDECAAQAAAQNACERLVAMRALRDPRDAVEPVRAFALLVRLAQAAVGDEGGGGGGGAALPWRAEVLARARQLQDELAGRGIVTPGDRAESRWLGQQASTQ